MYRLVQKTEALQKYQQIVLQPANEAGIFW